MNRPPQFPTVLVVGPEWAESHEEEQQWTPVAEAIGKVLAEASISAQSIERRRR